VLPVPFGKSIRGTRCRVIGFLLLFGPAIGNLFVLTGAYTHLFLEVHMGWFWWIWTILWAAVAGLSYPAALAIYLWALPTAEADFALDD
jgi:hypothetical protein